MYKESDQERFENKKNEVILKTIGENKGSQLKVKSLVAGERKSQN